MKSVRISLKSTGPRSRRRPSRGITDKVLEEMQDWSARPLDEVCTRQFSSMRSSSKFETGRSQTGRSTRRSASVSTDGATCSDCGPATGGEGAKFWMSVLTDIRNRGTRDVFFLVCDGLKGLPEVVENVWPATTVQTCVVHLIRNTFRLSGRQHWDALKHDLRPIYTAPTRGCRSRGAGRSRRALG